MPSAGFEPATPEIERLQNCTATEIGSLTRFIFPQSSKRTFRWWLDQIWPNAEQQLYCCFQIFAAIRFFCNNAADFSFVLPVHCGANPITDSTFNHLAFATLSRYTARGHKIVAWVFSKQVQTAKYRQSRITWSALIIFCFTPCDWLKMYRGKIFPVQALKTYGGEGVELHSFLTSALDGGEWLTL